jgi:membrane protein implicated in regulation of membrane protease activity
LPPDALAGLYLAVFLALPTGVVIVYFLLKGSWDHAFIGFAIFVTCALILTSVRPYLSRDVDRSTQPSDAV